MNTTAVSRFGLSRSQRSRASTYPAAERAPAWTTAPRASVSAEAGKAAANAVTLRAALVAGSLAGAVLALFATAGVAQLAEPELELLLRGMAAIKGLLAVAAAGLVWWRLGQPIPLRVASTYIACTWILFVSSALIWQLAFIPAAAVLFHAGGLVGLVVALRDSIRQTSFAKVRLLAAADHFKR